jgi:hypothetical protein
MAEVTIPTGQSRDGWIVLSVNGNVQWVKAGVPTTELDATELEVLGHAGINYTLSTGADPLILADFKNGVYRLNGADVTFDDLFEEDLANWGNYEETMLVPGLGMTSGAASSYNRFMVKPSVAALVADGATIVPNVSVFEGGACLTRILMADSASLNYYFTAEIQTGGVDMSGWDDGNAAELLPFPYGGSEVKVAFNLSRTRIALSLNGGAVQASDTIDPGPFAAIALQVTGYEDMYLESLGFYPLQDEADLPTLSALS